MKKSIIVLALIAGLSITTANAQVYSQHTLDSIKSSLITFIKDTDTNGDKKVTFEELNKLTEEKFNEFDKDNNSGLDSKEYKMLMFNDLEKGASKSKELKSQLSELKKKFESQESMVFKAIDTNNDGLIQLKELLSIEKKAFQNMDYNKDSVISLKDFEKLKKEHSK